MVQIDTPEDVYYVGTCDQLNMFAEVTSSQKNTKHNARQHGWAWTSDLNILIQRDFVGVTNAEDTIDDFERTVRPIFRVISVKSPQTGDTISTLYKYTPQEWDVIFADGSLLMGSAAALETAISEYDCIVNCTSNIKRPAHIVDDSCYVQLAWEDHPDQDILSGLRPVLAQMQRWITVHKKRVMVHCEQGVSRSGACVLAFLMLDHSFDKAYTLLRAKRPIAKPNAGFIKQLKIGSNLCK